mmetsp:Transcript_1437/g.4534  ORF Transcript_1437/g.4534 Transcript_1437/m.4534 type:complete len:301 (+) Transcript_1437:3065-3967(+)
MTSRLSLITSCWLRERARVHSMAERSSRKEYRWLPPCGSTVERITAPGLLSRKPRLAIACSMKPCSPSSVMPPGGRLPMYSRLAGRVTCACCCTSACTSAVFCSGVSVASGLSTALDPPAPSPFWSQRAARFRAFSAAGSDEAGAGDVPSGSGGASGRAALSSLGLRWPAPALTASRMSPTGRLSPRSSPSPRSLRRLRSRLRSRLRLRSSRSFRPRRLSRLRLGLLPLLLRPLRARFSFLRSRLRPRSFFFLLFSRLALRLRRRCGGAYFSFSPRSPFSFSPRRSFLRSRSSLVDMLGW